MCGFVGVLADIKNIEQHILDDMTNVINHRGPDDQGSYQDEDVYLGFRRLSIIALESGVQPYAFEDYRLVFNGEIYNYIELREQLIAEGYTFTTDSEAEVILTSYKHYGEEFVPMMRGMYAMLIWDVKNKVLFGARDHFGIKPFYYMDNEEGLYLGSELKSFTKYKKIFPSKIKTDSLQNYLSYQFVPEPNTMLEGIKVLEPGCTIKKVVGGKTEIKRYHRLEFQNNNIYTESDKEITQLILDTMKESVKFHMRSDVPVGSFLSGGIDSTLIATLAAEEHHDLNTFTIGFEINGYSEIELAAETAKHLGVKHYTKMIKSDEFIKAIPQVIWHLDGPVADPSVIPIYFIAGVAKEHVKVVLSGEGADELFGGYNIYREPIALKHFKKVPKGLRKGLAHVASIFPEGMKGKSFIQRGCMDIEDRYIGNAKIFKDDEARQILKGYNMNQSYTEVTKPYYEQASAYDDVTKMQYIDINTWLRGDILVKSDRLSMAHGLELRVPFLDKEVFAVASRLGFDHKLGQGTTKHLLREAAKLVLPDHMTMRRKLGYPVPIRVWLKDELFDWAMDVVEKSQVDDYIYKDKVKAMIIDHRDGKMDYSRKIWTVLTFMIWHQLFIEDVTYEFNK